MRYESLETFWWYLTYWFSKWPIHFMFFRSNDSLSVELNLITAVFYFFSFEIETYITICFIFVFSIYILINICMCRCARYGTEGWGGGGGVAQHPLTRAPGYNFPLFLVYPADMPERRIEFYDSEIVWDVSFYTWLEGGYEMFHSTLGLKGVMNCFEFTLNANILESWYRHSQPFVF